VKLGEPDADGRIGRRRSIALVDDRFREPSVAQVVVVPDRSFEPRKRRSLGTRWDTVGVVSPQDQLASDKIGDAADIAPARQIRAAAAAGFQRIGPAVPADESDR
jgi:hypothetical protein